MAWQPHRCHAAVQRPQRGIHGAGVISLAALVQAALYFPAIARGEVIEQRITWLPTLGLDLVLRMDGLAWLFTMLVLGIGALVVLYARYYMSPADPVPRFFAFLMSFMGAMTGVVLSATWCSWCCSGNLPASIPSC